MVNITRLATTKTSSVVNIGNRLCIAGHSKRNIPGYYNPYKPIDKYDCRDVYGNCKLSQSYWEAVSQGANDITCVSIPEVNEDVITSLLSVFDTNTYDIIVLNNIYATDYHHFEMLDEVAYKLNNLGASTLFVLSCLKENLTYGSYVNKLKTEYSKIKNPQYFAVTIGDVQYNTYSEFQYNTDSAATVGGLLSAINPYTDPVSASFVGINLVDNFLEEDYKDLCDKGYTIIKDTINKGKTLKNSYTYAGKGILTVTHMRVVNSISQYLNLALKNYYGNAINMIALTADVKYVLDWHLQNGYCSDIKYDVYKTGLDTIEIKLSIVPLFSIYSIDVSLSISLNKS